MGKAGANLEHVEDCNNLAETRELLASVSETRHGALPRIRQDLTKLKKLLGEVDRKGRCAGRAYGRAYAPLAVLRMLEHELVTPERDLGDERGIT
jgi:hypothetical protein